MVMEYNSPTGSGSTTSVAPPNDLQARLSRERVLVMDDEAPIRMMISRLLTHIGIGDIETAADGTDAVGIYKYARSVNRPFSAVILDMTVPGGIGGLDVIEKLRSIDPEVKVILTSGHANAIDEPAMKERGFCAILDKPYTLDQMRQTLLQVLDLVAEPV